MKYSDIEQMRVWAALTGIVLAIIYFAMVWSGNGNTDRISMLTMGVAGFELFFFSQELSRRWRARNG